MNARRHESIAKNSLQGRLQSRPPQVRGKNQSVTVNQHGMRYAADAILTSRSILPIIHVAYVIGPNQIVRFNGFFPWLHATVK